MPFSSQDSHTGMRESPWASVTTMLATAAAATSSRDWAVATTSSPASLSMVASEVFMEK